jgi:O-antigen ligase
LLYFSKGEGLRNILLFGSFAAWVVSLKGQGDARILRNPLGILYLIFVGISATGILASMDVSYSADAFKHEALKGILLFFTVASLFTSERRLKWLFAALCFSVFALIGTAFYSYATLDIPFVKPHISLMHHWHNKFARYLCNGLPFVAVLALTVRYRRVRGVLWLLGTTALVSVMLSTSRAGLAALVVMIAVWMTVLMFFRRDMRRALLVSGALLVLIASVTLTTSPVLQQRLKSTGRQMSTMNKRLDAWIPMYAAIRERPVLGWGYGPKLVRRDEPYMGTGHAAPSIGAHNTFLEVAFASGTVGLVSYVSLLGWAMAVCVRGIVRRRGNPLHELVFLAVLSILVGNYVIHSMFANVSFRDLSMFLGILVAVRRTRQ